MTTADTRPPHSLESELAHFMGDLQRYRSISPRLIYTPGVRHLAQEAGAHWLIDAIASYVDSDRLRKAIRKDERVRYLHFWNLTVNDDGSAVLTARIDRDEAPFIRQAIEFTDFLLSSIDLWCGFNGESYTLYLPSEH